MKNNISLSVIEYSVIYICNICSLLLENIYYSVFVRYPIICLNKFTFHKTTVQRLSYNRHKHSRIIPELNCPRIILFLHFEKLENIQFLFI